MGYCSLQSLYNFRIKSQGFVIYGSSNRNVKIMNELTKKYENHSLEELQDIVIKSNIEYRNFLQKTEEGYEVGRKSSVVVCSLVQNAESYLPRFFNFLRRLSSNFWKFSIILYENDSIDDTKLKINNTRYIINCTDTWYTIKNLDFISENGIEKPKFPTQEGFERANYMAMLRNKYLNKVKEEYLHYDYMIVVDSDLRYIEIDGIFNSLGYSDLWDGIGTNGIDIYRNRQVHYDIWSLIIDNKIHMNSLAFPWAMYEYPFKVQSCFGGIGIYKIKSILDKEYKPAQLGGRCGSEHTGLHLSLKNFYMNPSARILRLDKSTTQFNVQELK